MGQIIMFEGWRITKSWEFIMTKLNSQLNTYVLYFIRTDQDSSFQFLGSSSSEKFKFCSFFQRMRK